MTAPARFNPTVHGARGLFAMFVFIYHVFNSGLPTWAATEGVAAQFVLRCGEYGVELFFGISGYVIAGTLRRATSPVAFLEDRAFRIYPPLWVSLLIIAAAGMVTRSHGFETMTGGELFWRLPINMLALPGLLPIGNLHPAAWSLSYEMGFYLACTALWTLRRRGADCAMSIAIGASLLILALFPRGLFFLAGVLVAEGVLPRGLVRVGARLTLFWLLIFLLAWGSIRQLTLPLRIIDTTLFAWLGDVRLPLAIVAFAAATLAFAGIAAGAGLFGRALRLPVMAYLGTISYSFYLWHPLVMSACKTAMVHSGLVTLAGPASQLVFLLLALPPSLLVAQVSQRLLERDAGLWLRRRFHHRPPVANPAVPAAAETQHEH